jgi:hypothetical protein
MKIFPERMTHRYEGELVVFMIGMRINRLWRPDQWLPTFLAMSPMLTELSTDPTSGLLGFRFTLGAGGPVLVQYWASKEQLYTYAGQRDAAHRPAWAAFNARARKAPAAVGIWHETYLVDSAESMYVGMPLAGLARATEHVPVAARTDRARDRMAGGRTKTVG